MWAKWWSFVRSLLLSVVNEKCVDGCKCLVDGRGTILLVKCEGRCRSVVRGRTAGMSVVDVSAGKTCGWYVLC